MGYLLMGYFLGLKGGTTIWGIYTFSGKGDF